MMDATTCRNCSTTLTEEFVDLGLSPLANSYLTSDQLRTDEPRYPLRAMVCDRCFLVQLAEFESPQHIFSEYAYFSSFSRTWLEHSRRYTEAMIRLLGLTSSDEVVEIASNDGYLLRNFVEAEIPVLGIEPAANVAKAAENIGVPTMVAFFGADLAVALSAAHKPKLVIGNNVLAHVPQLHDFVQGLQILLASDGVITMEFPHLLRLMQELQFDTIYHEHFSYLSLGVVTDVFAQHGLRVVRVEELDTHGGSLRIYAEHENADALDPDGSVEALKRREETAGLGDLATYRAFGPSVLEERARITGTVAEIRRQGGRIAGFGAPAKGNTLLNFCGLGVESMHMTVDASPAKQGRYLPGSHIPIYPPERLIEDGPDVVWILPWNLKEEIARELEALGWEGETLVRSPGKGLA